MTSIAESDVICLCLLNITNDVIYYYLPDISKPYLVLIIQVVWHGRPYYYYYRDVYGIVVTTFLIVDGGGDGSDDDPVVVLCCCSIIIYCYV